MAYNSATDFLALLRNTANGERIASVPGLDYVVSAMARAGMFTLSVSQAAPTMNQSSTVWFKPASPNSWSAEGAVFLWNSVSMQYEPAHPSLWGPVISGSASVVQDVTVAGPTTILVATTIVRVGAAGAPVSLVLPSSTTKDGAVLVSDWRLGAGANNITISLADGADRFPGNLTTWTLAADNASALFRPVSGGYVL
jgi:hypothetical protein